MELYCWFVELITIKTVILDFELAPLSGYLVVN